MAKNGCKRLNIGTQCQVELSAMMLPNIWAAGNPAERTHYYVIHEKVALLFYIIIYSILCLICGCFSLQCLCSVQLTVKFFQFSMLFAVQQLGARLLITCCTDSNVYNQGKGKRSVTCLFSSVSKTRYSLVTHNISAIQHIKIKG